MSLANPRGDAVTTIDIPAAQSETTSATSITAWTDYTENDTPTASATSTGTVAGPAGYAFLGAKQRTTDPVATAGLTLMGNRLYNPTRGLFASPDPEPGGNESSYGHPNNPVTSLDLDGHCEQVAEWCVRRLLTSTEPWPKGFITYLRRKNLGAAMRWTQTGYRAVELGGDHCPSVPSSGRTFNFHNACDTHDIGYQLIRFWMQQRKLPYKQWWAIPKGWVDTLFRQDMLAECRRRGIASKIACRSRASTYYGFVSGWWNYL